MEILTVKARPGEAPAHIAIAAAGDLLDLVISGHLPEIEIDGKRFQRLKIEWDGTRCPEGDHAVHLDLLIEWRPIQGLNHQQIAQLLLKMFARLGAC